jgi:predicted nucleic acid-binding protein
LASYLVDTNVLLDACFVKPSWSSKCLHHALREADNLFTTEVVLEEARERITHHLSALRDPSRFISGLYRMAEALKIEVLNDVSGVTPDSIPKNDRFLWPTARSRNLVLLTRDIETLIKFRIEGASSISPAELIRDSIPDQNFIFGGVTPRRTAGTIYFHGRDNYWRTKISEPVNIIHLGEAIYVDYVPSIKSWQIDGAACPRAFLYECRDEFDPDVPKKFAVTWGDGALRIYDSSQEHPSNLFEIDLIEFGDDQKIQIGDVGCGRLAFMGNIQAVVFDDRKMSKDFWKKIRHEDEMFTPQPFDNDRLKMCLRHVDLQ